MAEGVPILLRLRSRKDGAWIAPPDLRPRLVEEAKERDTSLTDLIVQILSRTYRVKCEAQPSSRRSSPPDDGSILKIYLLPLALYTAIAASAAKNQRTTQREILAALSAHYGLRLPPKAKRPRRRGAVAA